MLYDGVGDVSFSSCRIVAEVIACEWVAPLFSAFLNSVISCNNQNRVNLVL